MAWTKLTKEVPPPTAWFTWTNEPGQKVEGKLVAVKDGRFSAFAVMEQDDLSLANVPLKGWAAGEDRKIADLVRELPVGSMLMLVFVGAIAGKRGRPRLTYALYVQESV